ncbi:hypothetical protein ACFXKW_35630 [Streptomyces sp. NPDC059193]|uniref:hypothetical protein n=1 Tax=Streptomyces sp. NPDC059193 TaxID=3346763 RepID=UPI003693FD9E
MHIPDYARATIRAALPTLPTARHVGAVDCCLCDEPFGDRLPVPLGPTPESGLFACHPCLARLVARARRTRDAALTQDAEQARAESAAWLPVRESHLARLDGVRQAAEGVARLAGEDDTEPLQAAWLLVSLESAYAWIPDAPEPPASVDREVPELRDAAFQLDLAMISARDAVVERLAYYVINEAQPAEPDMCEEFACPDGCSGRHDSSHIDCGPDAIYEDLARHDVIVRQPEPEPTRPRPAAPPAGTGQGRPPLPDIEENAPAVLAHFGFDADDTELLVSAAAVGLVAVAEFVRHVDDRVWFTEEVIREQGWRAGLLHRAMSAAFGAPCHFGMPGWPDVVARAVERLGVLDRSEAPEALADLAAVGPALLEAPDRLGANALEWLCRHGVFAP